MSCCKAQGKTIEKKSCCGGCCCKRKRITLSESEIAFVSRLSQTPFLPITRFIMKSSKSEHISSVALAPVYIEDKTDSMEQVKDVSSALISLCDYGIISLDYEIPLENYDYTFYESSELYAYFKETVREGQDKQGFLFDTPVLECGSLALTALGQQAIENLK